MTDLTTGIPSVHYRGYLIDICEFRDGYTYAAEDYDGAEDGNDNRCGHTPDISEAKAEIDEIITAEAFSEHMRNCSMCQEAWPHDTCDDGAFIHRGELPPHMEIKALKEEVARLRAQKDHP